MDRPVKTRVFELATQRGMSLPTLAKAMQLDRTLVWRVKRGDRRINDTFIAGAKRAFPSQDLGYLFYIEDSSAEQAIA